jgi:predicted nucleotidyltransferase
MVDQTQTSWTAETILDFLREHADELRAMGVVRIGLFGSYVRGEQRPDSDIDFLVQMRSPSYRDFMNVWNFLEDQLGRKVDLGEEHLLKPIVRPYVLREVKYAEGF